MVTSPVRQCAGNSNDPPSILDPDQQVQQAVRLVFATFRRLGSASSTVRWFREHGLRFPHRVPDGPHRGDLLWRSLQHSTVLAVLHNPRYAGAFVFGKSRTRTTIKGRHQQTHLPRDQWFALVPGAHDGYITWEDYEENERRLRENAAAHGTDRAQYPPREGPALLQALAICGRCGRRLTVQYHARRGRLIPDYRCQQATIEQAARPCQVVPGGVVDAAIGDLLVAAVTPQALTVALAVQAEVLARAQEADQVRCQAVTRARYEADLAQRRFLRVDPEHRLVAAVLEADWNATLRHLQAAQEEVERHRQRDAQVLTDQQQATVLALAQDFPRLWRDPHTPDRERKRMVRLLIEDVTVTKAAAILLGIRFKGGAVQTLSIPLPLSAPFLRRTDHAVVEEIDRLLDEYTDAQIAETLNARGYHSFDGKPFHAIMIANIRQRHHLRNRFARLRGRGLLTNTEIAARLGISCRTVEVWRDHGLVHGERYNDRGMWLYHVPDATPAKCTHKFPASQDHPQTCNGGAV